MSTSTTIKDVLRELAALEDPKMREANERRGDDHGVNLTHLRSLAKRLKTQHELALQLWATGDTAARLLATLVCRPKAFSAPELDAMIRDIRSPKLLDWFIAAVSEIKDAGGSSVRGVVADVTTADGAAILLGAAGQVDILVNNLGIYESKAFSDITDDDWMRFFEINVVSGARLARAVFPGMLQRNHGRIIFVSSESALSVPKDMIHYAVTKTAQLTIARGLAELTKGTKVTVNSVMPGPTRAAGIESFLRSQASDPSASIETIEAEFFATARASSLLQRMIEPAEIANLVAYLASPLASATNGAAVRVEGGLLPTIA